MMTKSVGAQGELHTLTLEGLVPQDNLFRKIQSLADFSFVHDEAKAFYCAKNGRPSVDPIVVVKYLLIGFLRGIPSERRIEEQINENNAYRWFLGLEPDERARLEAEGKIPPKRPSNAPKTPKRRERKVSEADPDAGILNRPGKPGGFHYLDHQCVDAKRGIIVDALATSGNACDTEPFLAQIERAESLLKVKIEAVAADSAYDASLFHRELDERGTALFTPKKTVFDYSKTEFSRKDFAYDETQDVFVCPNGETLKLRRLRRNEATISREYRAEPTSCGSCPRREKRLAPSQRARKIQVNIFEKTVRKRHEKDGGPEHKNALKMRQIWCEGTFAARLAAGGCIFLLGASCGADALPLVGDGAKFKTHGKMPRVRRKTEKSPPKSVRFPKNRTLFQFHFFRLALCLKN
jgi:hypothetical protein